MTSYTVRSNAIRAARKALGATAQLGTDFTLSSVEGGFAWAAIAADAPAAGESVGALVVEDPGERQVLVAAADVQAEGLALGPVTVARVGDADRAAEALESRDLSKACHADMQAAKPVRVACNSYTASLGCLDPGEYRITPEGEARVPDLVPIGAMVATNYGTGGRVVLVTPCVYKSDDGRELEHFTLVYVKPERYGRHTASDYHWINECVAVGGRILQLFQAGTDEVTVVAVDTASAVDEYRVTPEGQPKVSELVVPGAFVATNYGTGGRVVSVDRQVFKAAGGRALEHFTINYVPAERFSQHGLRDVRQLYQYVAVDGRILRLFASKSDEVTVTAPPSPDLPALPGTVPVAVVPLDGATPADGTLDCPAKAASVRRMLDLVLATNFGPVTEPDGAGNDVPCANFVALMNRVLDGAYEAGYAAAALALPLAGRRKAKAPKAARTSTVKAERSRGVNKRDLVGGLLRREGGCTNREILEATGWPSVSVPAQARASGLTLKVERVAGQPTRYYGVPQAA